LTAQASTTPQAPAAAALTVQALLNCLAREVCTPLRESKEEEESQAPKQADCLILRLPRSGALLRARLSRSSAGLGPRFTGDAEEHRHGRWELVGWRRLADLAARELTLGTGAANPDFTAQVRESHAAIAAIIRARAEIIPAGSGAPQSAGAPIARYLASEQSLIAGHRFHPAPKARRGTPREWLRYAPEAEARFRLRFLAVREDAVAEAGDTTALDGLGVPAPPDGFRVLPAHPWQFRLQTADPGGWLRRALDAGLLLDLGEGTRAVAATSSVRTVYDPVGDVFCKFSLGVRITNCVRTSAWYELAGSVELSRLLAPVFAALATRYPGVALLGEPGYRTVAASARHAYEGLAVIARDGIRPHLLPGVIPLLSASLTEPASAAMPLPWPADRAAVRDWWQAYLRLLVPPVLDLLVNHGVALEPHLQNVLVAVDAAGMPAQVLFRDLEGTKLIAEYHAPQLAAMPQGVADGLSYAPERAWDRVLYCLVVNHLAEIAAALADRVPDRPEALEALLWSDLRDMLVKCGADLGWPPRIRALLAGCPLPGKANLRVRWARAADREAGYLPVPSPFRLPQEARRPPEDIAISDSAGTSTDPLRAAPPTQPTEPR
jgi:siderophore synthetase component